MKKAYVINYDLNNTKDYDTLFAEIHTLGGKRVLKSCWLIMSSFSAKAIRYRLLSLMDGDDGIFVVRAHGAAAWRKVECANKWLKENLQSQMA
ncbi:MULTISPECIES: CRISPR-associated protein Cas2 [Sphingobacterium]|uniref:CRISPR-associated protein Cas2 n=1 Tax=Sphingobacterium siyangense TaxID=459529 RepID=A0A562M7F3_9SPHI|nr:CRISPR-associated protein Cas2 [Sphingobacterium siyangense]TWI15501.1 hypothetical protein IQ31_05083 [Sphingobacterium siyangense]